MLVGAKIRTEFQYLSFLKHSCNFFVALACYLCGGQKKLRGGRVINSSIFEQRSRFAMIGALMVIISLLFLFYMGSSLVSSTKKYLEQIQGIEITCIDTDE